MERIILFLCHIYVKISFTPVALQLFKEVSIKCLFISILKSTSNLVKHKNSTYINMFPLHITITILVIATDNNQMYFDCKRIQSISKIWKNVTRNGIIFGNSIIIIIFTFVTLSLNWFFRFNLVICIFKSSFQIDLHLSAKLEVNTRDLLCRRENHISYVEIVTQFYFSLISMTCVGSIKNI